MSYKFENLEVWQLSLEYTDHIYRIAEQLPGHERYNLSEQARFLEIASRSLIETVSVLHLIHRREYLENPEPLREAYQFSEKLFAKLQSFRSTLKDGSSVQEEEILYEEGTPF